MTFLIRCVRLMRLSAVLLILSVITGCEGGAMVAVPSSGLSNNQNDPTTQSPVIERPTIVDQVVVTQPAADEPQITEPAAATPAVTPATTPATTSTTTPAPAEPQPAPAQPAVRNPTVADITDLVLVTGQSNALGADTDYDPALDGPDNHVFAYTRDGWQVAELTQIWDRGWFPRTDPDTPPSNNLSLHFGKKVASLDRNRVVGFILVTAPGMPISHWHPDGSFFNSIRDRVSNAINELPSKSQVDGILWHQGESDGGDDPAYGQALYDVINNFRGESWFGSQRPFICGETASLPVNRQLNRLNSDDDPYTACIAAEGLETVGDNAHFTARALRTIGWRYAVQYLAMTR